MGLREFLPVIAEALMPEKECQWARDMIRSADWDGMKGQLKITLQNNEVLIITERGIAFTEASN